jgi:glycosyltransferase involved in cell wall biosynthesis
MGTRPIQTSINFSGICAQRLAFGLEFGLLFSLIVPCYNEEDNVLPFLLAARDALDGQAYDWELIYINDGSQDGTRDRLRTLAAEHPKTVRAVTFSRNFGKEAALLAGLHHAKGDVLCFIDADLQQPPAFAAEMLQTLLRDPDLDCVCAVQEVRREGKLLSAVKGAFYKLGNKLTDVDFVNGASDFRVFRRPVADALLALTEGQRFSKGLFAWVGFDTLYVPYRAAERLAGKSKWSPVGLLRYGLGGIISFTTRPLRAAVVVGIVSALLSLVYLVAVWIQKLFFSIDVPGYATIVTLVLLLGGLQLFFFGVLGEYLARVFTETKRRPPYIIKEALNTNDIHESEEIQ